MGSEPDFRFFLVSRADPDFSEATMARTIIVDGGEKIACPKCNHGFPLSEGISRQTIERYAEDFERSVAAHRKKLEAELAAEAKAQFDSQRKAMNEALGAKEGALARFRSEELQLRRHLRELEEADKNRDVDYQRRLDEERRRIESQFKAQIESAQREAADLKRKLEQGSQQLQGEARPRRENGARLQLHLQPAVHPAGEVRGRRLRRHAPGPGGGKNGGGAHVQEARVPAHPHERRPPRRRRRPPGHRPGKPRPARHHRRLAGPAGGRSPGVVACNPSPITPALACSSAASARKPSQPCSTSAAPATCTAKAVSSCSSTRRRGRALRKPTPAPRARPAAFGAPTRSWDRTASLLPSATDTGA